MDGFVEAIADFSLLQGKEISLREKQGPMRYSAS
jgi:hypothetical protein